MRYDAFISYRHADLDLYIAKKLHKGLETFKVPRAVAKKSGKKNIKRVFRDQEELPIGSDLGDNIEAALAESEFLIVICSPRTPESYWVQKEISTFIQMHGREHVLAVLIEGEPEQSFPALLLVDDEGNPVEPLAADVRGETKREVGKKLRTEIMRLAAPLLSCSYDDLRQRHRERKMRRAAAVCGAIALLAVLFGAYSTYNAALIRQNYEGKLRNQSKYLADTSLTLLEEGDRRAAVLVALEALPSSENDKPYVAEAQYALSQALYCYDTGDQVKKDRILQHDLPVSDFRLNEEGTMALSIDQGNNVYVWDLENGKKLAQIAPRIDESGYVNKLKGAALCGEHIILCEEWCLRSVSFDGQEEWYTENSVGTIYCEFAEDALMVACVDSNEVNFYDITNGELIDNMPNLQETSYTGDMAFNAERTKFAVSHLTLDDGVEKGCVSVYDFTAQTIEDIDITGTFISDVVFSSDDNLIVASVMNDDIDDFSWSVATGYLQKINYHDGTTIWQDTYEYQVMGYEASSAQIKCRAYMDEITGEKHDEVLMSVDNTAYAWDNVTGEQITETRVDSSIVRFFVSESSGFTFLAGSNGIIDIVDMTEGFRYSAQAIQTGKVLSDIAIGNGMIFVRAYASPDLTIMKYHNGAGMMELEQYESSIQSIQYSTDETYYAVRLYDLNEKNEVSFYRTQDNTLVSTWADEEDRYAIASRFVSDTLYMAVCSDGCLVFYDVESEEKETLTVDEKLTWAECDMNEEHSLAFLYRGRQYAVIDLKQKKVLTEGETEGYIFGGILAEDGRHAYCSIKDKGVCILDVETSDVTPIELDSYQVLSNGEVQDAFAISQDGQLLAVSCMDSVLRVLDLKGMKTVAEIPFAGVNRRFIQFTEDDTQIMLQGDDYYFRVYDLKTGEFSYVSTDQYYEIQEVMTDKKTNTISLLTIANMVILNRDDYERIAQVDGGKAYLPESARILCDNNDKLYQFPYMTLEMLIEEAQAQFGGESLTDLEKTRFHVE